MTFELITVAKESRIATLTLNRPKRLNAINTRMAKEMMQACDELDHDETVSCLVLRGAGRAFCAGGDLGEASELGGATTERLWDAVAVWNRMGHRLKTLDLPVIAALHGYVYGAGFLLAACCDIRIAAADAEMGVLLTKPRTFKGAMIVGSAADMGLTWILPRLIGAGRAAELMFTGESIAPEEAERIGFVNHVVPAGELTNKAMELAAKFAAGPRLRLRVTKRALNLSTYDRLAAHMEYEAAAQAHMIRAGQEIGSCGAHGSGAGPEQPPAPSTARGDHTAGRSETR
jgi:2-(1,2-epoxy-1,2-dihydrophenyl)acetyl-CoA isomerase